MNPLRLCVCLAVTGAIGAQAATPNQPSDPMRPPPEWLAVQQAGQASAPQESPFRPNIIVRGPGRTMAWVDGQPVRVGQMVGDSRVVRIDGHRVLLANGTAIQMLEAARLQKYGDGK